jgi:hypothetical protein
MTRYEKKRFTLAITQRGKLKKALIAYYKRVAANVEKVIKEKGVNHFEDNLQEYLLIDEYAEIVYKFWGETGAKFAEITEEDIRKQYYINQKRREPVKLSTGFFSQTYIDNMVRYAKATAGELITLVNETTIYGKLVGDKRVGGVKGALVTAGEKRLGAKATAQLIQKLNFSPARALTIARTETTAAAEAGSYITAKSWNVEMITTWKCAFKNSRDSHISADGETVKLGAYFTVGGAKMKYPGDRSGGAGARELVNCNCTTLNKVVQPPEPESIQSAYKPREREFAFSHLVTSLIALFVDGSN